MAAASAEELPSGWESATSRTTGETYYVNTRTGESQYEMPTADADGRSAAEAVQPSVSAVIAAAEAEATAEAAKAKQAERLGKLDPEDGAPSPPADDGTAAEGSARTRSLARGKALFGKAKTKAAAVNVSDSKAAALKHTSAVVSQSRKGLARAADGATNIGGVSHIVEKQRLKSDQQDAMMDHVVEMTEKCSQLQMELEDARTELEALRAQENADERVAELRAALAEAEDTAQEAARQAAQTAEKAAQHAQQASDDATRLEDARSQSAAELEELRNELAATRLQLRGELAECKAENERGMEVVHQELAEERLAHSALRARAAAGQADSDKVLAAEKAAHEATRQEAAETLERIQNGSAKRVQDLEAKLQDAGVAAAATKDEADRSLKQRLVAIEAKHQQATQALKAEVADLTRKLQTERMALQSAQALNEKLFNEMNAVV